MNQTNNGLSLVNGMLPGIGFNESGTGLTFEPKQVSYEAWKEAGIRLGQMQKMTGFALGDWIAYGQVYIKPGLGDDKEGKYDAAIAATGLDIGTLYNMASIAAKYLPNERVAELTFTHHQEVAYVEKKVRAKLLNTAAEQHLSVKALRDAAPKKTKKKTSGAKELARRNAKLIVNQTEIVKYLRKMKNPLILAHWYDVLYSLMDCLPDVLSRAEEAKKKADEQNAKEAANAPY